MGDGRQSARLLYAGLRLGEIAQEGKVPGVGCQGEALRARCWRAGDNGQTYT